MNWKQSTSTLGPSKIVASPCRRCGKIIKVPNAPDTLCGGTPIPRSGSSSGYNPHPPSSVSPQSVNPIDSTAGVPLEGRAVAIEGGSYDSEGSDANSR